MASGDLCQNQLATLVLNPCFVVFQHLKATSFGLPKAGLDTIWEVRQNLLIGGTVRDLSSFNLG
ncbi:MAG TPA: hypothetical protein DCR20_02205 [Planctomycetaceae bacterium]|jgi:hypothetical protein|nr:hypothetical protein [Planctomycetaceae bacterium]